MTSVEACALVRQMAPFAAEPEIVSVAPALYCICDTVPPTMQRADFGLAIDLREERAVTRAGTLGEER